MAKNQQITKALKALDTEWNDLVEAGASAATAGVQMRETAGVIFERSESETQAFSYLTDFLTAKAGVWMEANPRPEGETSTPQYKAWANLRKGALANPMKTLNRCLSEMVEAGTIKGKDVGISLSMAGKATPKKAGAPKKPATAKERIEKLLTELYKSKTEKQKENALALVTAYFVK